MNDSISVSSSYSSATNSNSNSLNRSMMKSSRLGDIEDYLHLPMTPVRRRTRSQTIYLGDEVSTVAEYNKQLIEDVYVLKRQLKEKDGTIANLNDVRNKLESEIQELSASLFEQAYIMVNTARAEAALSDKLLKEANGKIDVLQAEVKALKELVLTSTPSTPNKHLHPQLGTKSHSRQSSWNQNQLNLLTTEPASSTPASLSPSQVPKILNHSATSLQPLSKEKSSIFTKSHKRAPSHNDIQTQSKSLLDKLFQPVAKNPAERENKNFVHFPTDIAEFDPIYFREMSEWKCKPNLDRTNAFLDRVYQEDILPCLNFSNRQISEELLRAIEANCVCIEELSPSQLQSDASLQICGLSNIQSYCQYKIKLCESSEWIYISKLSRNRVISVCDFFTYLRYIKDGLVKSDLNEIYWNIIDLRKKITLSRLGL
ncbi:guanine nucleotide exchange factor for Rab-3A isoform X5 [Brachionus plicatilis]|uniref:Guanine nucleotide exchange factor for Rab-3A isoform X5 n=1 Tax=Brachionus plicatilis TaxID=10195 RepID=A0A3M7P9T2_BRAPC|nr:guanine nucleotide exchange factor for Rab-3A isoform X5 [Brachionus plicatilis]